MNKSTRITARKDMTSNARQCWLIDRLRELAAVAGSSPAISGDESMDYSTLVSRIDEVGRQLRSQGVGPGQRVVVDRGSEAAFVIDFAAVLAIGATAIPLDPSLPSARKKSITKQARPSYVLGGKNPGPCDGAEPSDPTAAYVLFTSGTTGGPKGVEVSTISLDAYVKATLEKIPATPGDAVVLSHSTGFDFSQWDIWTALASGATLAIPRATTIKDPWQFAKFLLAHSVTHWGPPPTQFHTYLTFCPDMAEACSQLSVLLFAGETLPRDVLRLAQRTVGDHTRIFNAYGITETTVFNLCADVTKDLADSAVDLGDPIGENTLELRDENGLLLPDGAVEAAELLLAGPQLATRYIGREDLTTERFVDIDGTRMFVSGDLVRRNDSGRLSFVSRVDGQIKLNGFRIELEEIRGALTSHPEVESACILVTGAVHEEELTAALKCHDRPGLRDELVDLLSLRLPPYMVPSRFVQWEAAEWPTTPNGKEDVAAIRASLSGLVGIR